MTITQLVSLLVGLLVGRVTLALIIQSYELRHVTAARKRQESEHNVRN